MFAVLALVVGVALGVFLEPTVPLALQPVPADRGRRRPRRGVRRRPGQAGRHLRRQAVRHLVRVERPGGRRSSCTWATSSAWAASCPPASWSSSASASSATWPPSAGTCSGRDAATCDSKPTVLSAVPPSRSLLLLALGFALVVQLKSRNTDAELSSARPEDLVRILSDLDSQQDRLRREISDLEDTKRQLDSGAQGQRGGSGRGPEARRRAGHPGRHAAGGGARAVRSTSRRAPRRSRRRDDPRRRRGAARAPGRRRCRSPAATARRSGSSRRPTSSTGRRRAACRRRGAQRPPIR